MAGSHRFPNSDEHRRAPYKRRQPSAQESTAPRNGHGRHLPDRESSRQFREGSQMSPRGRQGKGERPAHAEHIRLFQPLPGALFPPLPARISSQLETMLPRALRAVRPLNRAHRAELPEDIAELSELLTIARAELRRPYWADPALTSAYLYYFLPWNLVRLTRLLAACPLPEPPAGKDSGRSILIDLGSGPLSLPIALWLARPEWRDRPVEVIALDCAGRPPRLGREILEALAQAMGSPCWKVHCVQAPVESAARAVHPFLKDDAHPWIVSAANVLNELPPERRPRFEEDEDDDGLSASEGRLEGLLESLAPLLQPRHGRSARMLLVEPGTRLGGTTLMHVRSMALEMGLVPVAPCTHSGPCPLLKEEGGENFRAAGRTWCHFTFPTDGAPVWLETLSREAGLAKETLSLSCLLLDAGQEDAPETEMDGTPVTARVISQPFAVPGRPGRCRYACAAQGLLLAEDAEGFAGGEALPVERVPSTGRDARSGAYVVRSTVKGVFPKPAERGARQKQTGPEHADGAPRKPQSSSPRGAVSASTRTQKGAVHKK